MDSSEYIEIFSPGEKDAEYLHEVAHVKRFLEYWSMEPGFQEAFRSQPEATLQAHHIDMDVAAGFMLTDKQLAKKQEKQPRAVRRYQAFIKEKLMFRTRLEQKGCAPEQPEFKAWRQRQVNRCWAQFGSRNASLIHAPLNFELDLGCSVGCPFCGVAAPPLQKVYRYTPDNAKLWREILEFAKEFIGPAAGTGTCYYATEPFDNPDYERFADDFFAVFNDVAQVTTAASMRNPERTRSYLAKAGQQYPHVHRFSVLSLDILHKIFDFFTPEELLPVELLPQFIEAPACHFSKVGRAMDMEEVPVPEDAQEGFTISCISGFVVNMAERSIRLLTPVAASSSCPTGELFIAKEFFTDFADFKMTLQQMIEAYMQKDFSRDMPLVLRSDVNLKKTEQGLQIDHATGFKINIQGSEQLPVEEYHWIFDALQAGGHTAYDTAVEMDRMHHMDAAKTFFILKQWVKMGLFLEPYEQNKR